MTTPAPPPPSTVFRLSVKEVNLLAEVGRQVSRRGKPEPGLRHVLHAWVGALKEPTLKVLAIQAVANYVKVDEARPRRHLRTTKKAESDSAQGEKAQASPKASQSKGILRAPPARTPATGTKGT